MKYRTIVIILILSSIVTAQTTTFFPPLELPSFMLIDSVKGSGGIESLWSNDYYYEYNSNNQMTLMRYGDDFETTYMYDSDGNLILVSNTNKNDIYTYDNNGNKTSYTSKRYQLNRNRYTYSYNHQNLMASILSEYWSDSKWKLASLGNIEYNSNNQKIAIRYSNRIDTLTYDSNGNKTSYLIKFLFGNNWVNKYQHIYTYNSNGNIIQYLIRYFNDEYGDKESSFTFEYNTNSNIIQINCSADEKLTFVDSFGNSYLFYSNLKRIIFGNSITSIKRNHLSITKFSLFQNYPNPFNPSTTIKYQIPSNVKHEISNTKLVVFDILGREIATLVNKEQPSGNYSVQFDASTLASGLYFYKLQNGTFVQTKKMLLIK